MGGTILRLVEQGHDVLLLDMTDGEPTPHGSRAEREREWNAAAEILNVRRRLLDLPNPPGPIAIDSKFPLESYEALRSAEDEPARQQARRALAQDLRLHVQNIAERYIIRGETAESALLFLPSEAVYAELHANFRRVVEESYKARVWIVSPTTLMATLNTVRAVLKDVRMREQAGVIQAEILKLHSRQTDINERLEDELETVTAPEEILETTKSNADVRIDDRLIDYINKIVRLTRAWPQLHMGASPRAGLSLMQAARTLAAFAGRDYAVPDDVVQIALPALRHRVMLTAEAEVEGHRIDDLLTEPEVGFPAATSFVSTDF